MNVWGVTFGGCLAKILSFKLGNLLYKSNFYLLSEGTVMWFGVFFGDRQNCLITNLIVCKSHIPSPITSIKVTSSVPFRPLLSLFVRFVFFSDIFVQTNSRGVVPSLVQT